MELSVAIENSPNIPSSILLLILGGASDNETIVKFESFSKQLFYSGRRYTLFFLSNSPEVWSWSVTMTTKENLDQGGSGRCSVYGFQPLCTPWLSRQCKADCFLMGMRWRPGSPEPQSSWQTIDSSRHFLTGPRAQLGRRIQFEHYSLVRRYWLLFPFYFWAEICHARLFFGGKDFPLGVKMKIFSWKAN